MRAVLITTFLTTVAVLIAPQTVDAEEICSPSCRPGYACMEGVCRGPCNPPCGAQEVCTRSGKCLPEKPAVPAAPARPRPTAKPIYSPDPDLERMDQERARVGFERRRRAGVALIIVGAIMGTVAGVLIGIGDDTGLIVGLVLAPAELAFVIPGIALTVVGAKGVRRIDKGLPVSLRLGLQVARAPGEPSHLDAGRSDTAPRGALLTLGASF